MVRNGLTKVKVLTEGFPFPANFLGPKDEWISSGSDDGNFFIWSKATGRLIGIYEGDQGVVNVVEDRPGDHSFPLLAASGLDNTVKVGAVYQPALRFID